MWSANHGFRRGALNYSTAFVTDVLFFVACHRDIKRFVALSYVQLHLNLPEIPSYIRHNVFLYAGEILPTARELTSGRLVAWATKSCRVTPDDICSIITAVSPPPPFPNKNVYHLICTDHKSSGKSDAQRSLQILFLGTGLHIYSA